MNKTLITLCYAGLALVIGYALWHLYKERYLLGGYIIGLVLLWGYALILLVESRLVSATEKARAQEAPANVQP